MSTAQPGNWVSSSRIAHKISMIQFDEPDCSDPQFRSHSSGKKIKISQREHKSLKNEYLSKGGLHRSQAPSSTKENEYTKKNNKKRPTSSKQ